MKVALVSLNQSWENKSENRKKVQDSLNLIFLSNNQNIDLVIYPEMTLTGFTMDSAKIKETLGHSETIYFIKERAKEYKVAIAFGVVLAKEERATNNLVVVDTNGKVISSYSKIHPFSYAKEQENYMGGSELVFSEIKNTIVGLTVCYDLRFPELYQGLSKHCKAIINIANWPQKRVEHWNTLLKARAIENQVFIIGVNRTGRDGNDIDYVKSSQIISPYGEVLKGEKLSEEVDIYEINEQEADRYRQEFPVKNDRKIELYKTIL